MISENVKEFCCEDISLIENYEQAMNDDTQIWHCHHRLEIVGDKITSMEELIKSGLYYNRPAKELIFLTVHNHMSLHALNRTDETLYAIGSANRNKKFSEEYCKKLSESQKNSVKKHETMQSEEYREKCRQSKLGERNPNFGKKLTDEEKRIRSEKLKGKPNHPQSKETREKLSKINKGKHLSEEVKIKISNSLKGRKLNEAQKERYKMSWNEDRKKEVSNRFKGIPKSTETKKKMSDSAKKRLSDENVRKRLSESIKNSEKYKQAMANRKGDHFFNNGVINVRSKECPEGFVPGRIRRN